MYQTGDEVVLKAALPGIKPDEVQINVTGDVLTIRGETKHEEDKQDKSWQIREHRWGAFERSVRLPTGVIADKAKAELLKLAEGTPFRYLDAGSLVNSRTIERLTFITSSLGRQLNSYPRMNWRLLTQAAA